MANDPIPGIMGQPPVSLNLLMRAINAHLERDSQRLTELGYPKLDDDPSTEYRTICLNHALQAMQEANRLMEAACKYEEYRLQQRQERS